MTFSTLSSGTLSARKLRAARYGALAVIAAAAAASPALAQRDEPTFTGFHVGIITGYDNDGFNLHSGVYGKPRNPQSGWLYGFDAGYDYQVGSNWVIGIEGELSDTTASKQVTFTGNRVNPLLVPPTTPVVSNVHSAGGGDFYVGLRGGYLVTPAFLLYAKGGYSHHKIAIDVNGTDNNVAFVRSDKIGMDGFRFGAGGEYRFNHWLYGKLEYRYSSYTNGGSIDIRGANVNLDPLFDKANGRRHQVALGVGLAF